MGVNVIWDCERARTPEGYYLIQGGIEYAIAKSLAVAPYCDLIWMETKTANLPDAKRIRRRHSCQVPAEDAGLQSLAVVQLGYHRHDRRGDARIPSRSWANWDSSSTSSPTADIKSMAWRRRNSPPP